MSLYGRARRECDAAISSDYGSNRELRIPANAAPGAIQPARGLGPLRGAVGNADGNAARRTRQAMASGPDYQFRMIAAVPDQGPLAFSFQVACQSSSTVEQAVI